jgi:hypothetical protein
VVAMAMGMAVVPPQLQGHRKCISRTLTHSWVLYIVVDDLEFHKSILMAILIAPNEFNHCLDLINILHV